MNLIIQHLSVVSGSLLMLLSIPYSFSSKVAGGSGDGSRGAKYEDTNTLRRHVS